MYDAFGRPVKVLQRVVDRQSQQYADKYNLVLSCIKHEKETGGLYLDAERFLKELDAENEFIDEFFMMDLSTMKRQHRVGVGLYKELKEILSLKTALVKNQQSLKAEKGE